MARQPGVRILVVNPNSTRAFTENIARLVPSTASVMYQYYTAPCQGPASINSVTSGVLSAAACLPGILALDPETYDGVLVCCFSAHPLVAMLREALPSRAPVVGIFEAALVHAICLGASIGIVTTEKRWEPLLVAAVHEFGFGQKFAGVLSGGLTVLEAESLPQEEVAGRLAGKAARLVEEKGADVIVLGCAGFVGLEDAVERGVGEGVPVVDGVKAGIEVLLGLVRTKQETSSRGVYALLR